MSDWEAYWRSALGHIKPLQSRRKYSNGPENAPKYAFRDPKKQEKILKILGRGRCPSPGSSPMGRGTL